MILTDKDAKTLEHTNKFKSVELNENFVDTTQALGGRPASPEDMQISLYEAKKLNQQHVQTIKSQRKLMKNRETQ